MKIIQTYWNPDKQGNPYAQKGGFLSPEVHWMSWALSCISLKKFHSRVELYTNQRGKDLLQSFDLPYEFKITHDNDFMSKLNPKLWAYSKIYTYSLQNEPFLHVDGDVYIWKAFNKYLLKENLIAQCLEYNWSIYKECIDDYKFLNNNHMPDWMKVGLETPSGYNAGILGGNNIDFIKRYSKYAIDFYLDNLKIWDEFRNLNRNLNVLSEQYLFYCLSLSEKQNVSCLTKKPLDSPEGLIEFANFRTIPHESSFFHALGGVKKQTIVNDFISYCLYKEDPVLWHRIINVCSKELKKQYYFYNPESVSQLESPYENSLSEFIEEKVKRYPLIPVNLLSNAKDLEFKQRTFKENTNSRIITQDKFLCYNIGKIINKWSNRNKYVCLSTQIRLFTTNYDWREITDSNGRFKTYIPPYLLIGIMYRNVYTGSFGMLWLNSFVLSILLKINERPYTLSELKKVVKNKYLRRNLIEFLELCNAYGVMYLSNDRNESRSCLDLGDYNFIIENRRKQISYLSQYLTEYYNYPFDKQRVKDVDNSVGVSLLELKEILQKLGLIVKALKVTFDTLNKIKLPVVAHVRMREEYEQYILIKEVAHNDIVIINPEVRAVEKYSIEEFNKIWDGIILLIEK